MGHVRILAGLSALVVAFSSLLCAQSLKVDHVTIAGRDLKQMQAMFASVNFPATYGGKHTNGLTEMALKSFADGSYLELIAAQSPSAGASGHYWAKFIDENAGPCAWAVSVPDVAGPAERLKRLGVPIELTKGGRKRPDGIPLAWETVRVGPAPQGTFFPFLIHDVTERDLRAFPQGRPSDPDIVGVTWVVTAVRDLAAAVAEYRKVFSLPAPKYQNDSTLGARLAYFPNTPVILAGAQSPDSWLAQRLSRFGEAPCAFVISSRSSKRFKAAGASAWFNQSVSWLNPDDLDGMRIGIIAAPK